MDENMNLNPNEDVQPAPPQRRRRKRSKWQIFKEAYLPVVIAGAALILCVSFVVGSVSRGKNPDTNTPGTSTEPSFDAAELLQKEAEALLADAEKLVAMYDYEGAMKLLNSYSGGISTNETLMAKYTEYHDAYEAMVPWGNINDVPNLSFRLLMADLSRALADPDYGNSFNSNYVTTGEFEKILNELYNNGYMLVSVYDLAAKTADANGNVTMAQNTLRLPEGKKPIVLTQVGVNYFTYIVDGDGDGLADKDGAGFASRLVLDENGNLTNEMVDAMGNVVTGSFDLVTVLNDFVAQHPDFSYRGAKATLAVTGYNGVFGYRINSGAKAMFGEESYNADRIAASQLVDKLREAGYDIACYTYGQVNYNSATAEMIKNDQNAWLEEIVPIIGKTDMLVYFKVSDIGDTAAYTGEKYDILSGAGYRFYIGAVASNEPWAQITGDYVRQNRILVSGSALTGNAQQFSGMFDAAAVVDPARS